MFETRKKSRLSHFEVWVHTHTHRCVCFRSRRGDVVTKLYQSCCPLC
jgi:hypothetical protein